MNFRPGTQWEKNLLPSIAPIFRIDLDKQIACLIGTGFWITKKGHLVTARHVIQDNIGGNGKDIGPIFAIQTRPDRSIIFRGLVCSDLHPNFDLALCETYCPVGDTELTVPLPISLNFLDVNEQVCSFAVFSYDQIYKNQYEGFTYIKFKGTLASQYTKGGVPIRFAIGFSIGEVSAIFEEKRDSVMLPFPCIETSVRIYGGNSGGPLIDNQGRICGIHCSSYDGDRISYHVPTHGLLNLQMTTTSFGITEESGKLCSVMDLAISQKIECVPPLLDESRLLRSCLLWIRYALRCKLNNEAISFDFNFGRQKGTK
ncbi:S1 family peptidase [Cellvibrio sp. QJXJ]|uniref:S1 family peptidase n=1 Tax=Cellvibrio sp. QJXJ TaxID=2964606 RepID=UPI0021C3D81E|nr:serine protease [Cellvibrio sp. QJXJ]UUA75224.1 serine protease [Cellvibrio sp. QJXJ]